MKLINMTYTGVKGHAILTSQAWPFAAAHKREAEEGHSVVDFYFNGKLYTTVSTSLCSVEFSESIQRTAIKTEEKRKQAIRTPVNVS